MRDDPSNQSVLLVSLGIIDEGHNGVTRSSVGRLRKGHLSLRTGVALETLINLLI